MAVHNLPHAAAPFVNRVSETAEITHRLNNADCRLLTLVGPGGIGKTRLAVRVAAHCANQFDDGVYFVPLQPLDSPEFIISAIADVIGFPFSPGADPQQQLLWYLQEKALLLLLDNFEHLLDRAELLTAILHAAPGIKILVTSREVLNLQEEWLYPVQGLHYPQTDNTEQPETYSAVQLFVERARRVRGDITLADEHAAIIRVCQLVEGMPLALELAAVWVKALPTDEIATEIQRNLEFLSTSLRNVPHRHQSIYAVFEQTWGRLTDEERRVFRALSVFSGGFRRKAAEAVTGVSLRVLSDLVDKSLLTREPDGRYQIHELLRQYAEARLETTPEEASRFHDLHADYYAHVLQEREQGLNGGRQREVALEIEAEIDNIRAAWSRAVEHSRIEAIDQSEYTLAGFYAFQSRLVEGANAFEKAARMLDDGDPRTEICLANVLYNLGWMCNNDGAFEKAQAAFERSWQLYAKHGVIPVPGRRRDPRIMLGFIYFRLGNISAAEALGQDALLDQTLQEDRFNLAMVCYLMANVARLQNQNEAARHYVHQGFAAAITQESGAPIALGTMLFSLGHIALDQGDIAEAIRCFEQIRAIGYKRGYIYGSAASLIGLGRCACAMGNYEEAQRSLCEALQIITRDRMLSLMPFILIGIGELFRQTGKQVRGIELLTFALHHPASDYHTKERAQRLLTRYQVSEATQKTSTKADFDAVTTVLLDELQIPENSRLTRHTPQAYWTLIEPLSERELEVLTLIADDLSNREIADKLFLSVATVKWYLTHIYSKLGVQNRTLAIMRARQLNLLP